jgi:hypothetical protein
LSYDGAVVPTSDTSVIEHRGRAKRWRAKRYMDEIKLRNFQRTHPGLPMPRYADLWYPGVDDIEIFDSSLSWFVVVTHDGEIGLITPGRNSSAVLPADP